MKIRVACIGALLMAVNTLFAQSALPAAAPAKASQPSATKPTTPAAKAAAPAATGAKKDDKKKEQEKEGKIEGMTINRPNGTFLGLLLQDGKYKLTFYDKKKKPMKVDVLRGIARWPNPHGPGNNQTVLNPAGDGTFLMGSHFVRGPHAFNLTIILVKSEGENAETETHTVPFRG